MDPPEPEKLTTKARVLGGTAFLLLGLIGLVMGVWFPIHWARTHPGQTADIPLRIVLAAPMLVLISVAAFAGKASKTVATVLAFIGLAIGFLLFFYMQSAIAGFAGAK